MQVERLDGVEVTRSMQILARQRLPALQKELVVLAEGVRAEKAKEKEEARLKRVAAGDSGAEEKEGGATTLYSDDAIDVEEVNPVDEEVNKNIYQHDAPSENTPEAREEIYHEMAQQKKEKQAREDANKPRKRDYEAEHKAQVEATRRKEEETGEREVRQKNEGGWKFRWDEETVKGTITLEVCLNRHLDSSLIDVDVHPRYVSMVVKSKVLRLTLPSEVRASDAKCMRSKTTGR
jgi:protein TilB